MNRNVIGTTALAIALTYGGNSLAASGAGKKSASSAAATRGQDAFEKRCVMCHYSDRVEKRVGPGLKGIYKRGIFVTNGNKVTDESLKAWIENGDSMMPPFKDVLSADELNNVVAYLKTL